MANKSWEATPERLEKIRILAQAGVSQASIAKLVGISPSTFHSRAFKDKHPEIDEIINAASAAGEEEAVGYLWDIIRNTAHKQHFSALCFYLKTRHNWRETSNETTPTNLPTGINFTVKE